MFWKTRNRGQIALATGLLCLFAAAVPSVAGSQSSQVLWQGATPEDKAAFVATVGRELRIPLEAAGPLGVPVRIRSSQLPAGARLEVTGDSPARATLRWSPSGQQLGDYALVFWAEAGTSYSTELELYVHVGRTAARGFRLSNVNGVSLNAELLRTIEVFSRPSAASRSIARLRPLTPESVPHILYLSSGRIGGDGRYWLRVPLPLLPNGRQGWIPREAVGPFRTVDTHLVIDRKRFRATLLKRGRRIFSSIVGVGEPRWPTPRGRFYIRERLTGFTDPIYGRLAFGTNGRSAILTDWPGGGFIGIHGTNQPEILPGRVSHGCVRLRNRDIRRLDRLMKVGTPVTIR